jgi:hypothetical protein
MPWLGLGLLDLVRGRRFEPADAGFVSYLAGRRSGGVYADSERFRIV